MKSPNTELYNIITKMTSPFFLLNRMNYYLKFDIA